MRRLILKVGLKLVAVACLPVSLVIVLMRPWLLVRFGGLISTRIGHFAANTEVTLCEVDAGIGSDTLWRMTFALQAGGCGQIR